MISALEFYGLKADGHTTLEGAVFRSALQSESCNGYFAGSGSELVHEGLSRGEPKGPHHLGPHLNDIRNECHDM